MDSSPLRQTHWIYADSPTTFLAPHLPTPPLWLTAPIRLHLMPLEQWSKHVQKYIHTSKTANIFRRPARGKKCIWPLVNNMAMKSKIKKTHPILTCKYLHPMIEWKESCFNIFLSYSIDFRWAPLHPKKTVLQIKACMIHCICCIRSFIEGQLGGILPFSSFEDVIAFVKH